MKQILLALAFVLLSALPSQAALAYYAPLTYDHTQVGSSDSSNFPIYFAGNAALKTVGNGGSYVQLSNGHDIQFFSDSSCSTLLDYELVTWDATTGLGEWWIRIATLSHSADGTIYVCVGDSGASDLSNATGVWNSNYKGVWHLKDGSSLSGADSTTNANTGTITAATATSGQVDGAASFNGSTAKIVIAAAASLNGLSATATASAWVNPANTSTFGVIVGSGRNEPGGRWGFFVNGAALRFTTWGVNDYDSSGITLSASTWALVAAKFTAHNVTFYVNGVNKGTVNGPANADTTGTPPWGIGVGDNAGSNEFFFNGSLDEVKITAAAQSDDWILAEYNNQKASSTLLSLGSFTATGGGGGGGSTPQTLPLLGVGPGQ